MMNPMNYKDEMYLAMLERTIRRLWVLSLVSIFLLVGSNIAWIYYESQFEDEVTESVEQEVDTGDNSGDTIVNGIGDINGTNKAKSDSN